MRKCGVSTTDAESKIEAEFFATLGSFSPAGTQVPHFRYWHGPSIGRHQADVGFYSDTVAKLPFHRSLKNISPVVEHSKILAGGTVIKLISRWMKL